VNPEAIGHSVWVDVAYLVTGICFIVGLRMMAHPRSARRGNRVAAAGMLIALVATCTQVDGPDNGWILAIGVLLGAGVGIAGALRVPMTAMPQMVALFNGAGGGAAALVSLAELLKLIDTVARVSPDQGFTIVLSSAVGALSFSGSIVAFLKLQELMTGRPITYVGQQIINLFLLAAIVLAGAYVVVAAANGAGALAISAFVLVLVASLALGVLFVLPIGGADMPVVISLLNSFTGLAAALTGFVLSNDVLIISGALVGASGTLLTLLMGKAMNRSVASVLFGAFGSAQPVAGGAAGGSGGNARAASTEDVATMLAYAQQVVVIPGYGMAVAQAQHGVRELADVLEKRGVAVKYAIHPVAGRMPGHMNVLLAEANVPYTSLYDMDDINPEFPRTDVALVIGANDVTNPAARTDKASPIYGMPILDVDRATNVVVLKRSMKPGFAGIDNPLYDDPRCVMLFGDAKKSVDALAAAVKAL